MRRKPPRVPKQSKVVQGRNTQQDHNLNFSPETEQQSEQRKQDYNAFLNQPINDEFSERTEWPPPSGVSNMNDFEPQRQPDALNFNAASNGSDSFYITRPEMLDRQAVLYEIQASPLSSESSDRDVRSSNTSQPKQRLEEPVVNELNRHGYIATQNQDAIETQVSDGW